MGKHNKLFGTDGIRSTFNQYPLDRESILKLGHVMGRRLDGSRIAIGRDTRHSGPEITALLAAGMGNRIHLADCGVIPTPGLAFVTQNNNFDYGIMITASHNPWMDNGIKIFTGNGEKIPASLEAELTELFFQVNEPLPAINDPMPEVPTTEAKDQYINFLSRIADRLPADKTDTESQSFKIVLDCANGATFETAPAVFKAAGFDTVVINAEPDGKNINLNCGSTMPDALKKSVVDYGAQLGIAFDGDGDRVMMTDNEGHILDGDHTLFLIAQYLLETEAESVFNKTVVGTVLGNLGLEKALENKGIRYIRTDVGDKYVYREMAASGAIIGGEQSGHTILHNFQKTGDGIVTALLFLEALFHFKLSPVDVYRQLKLYPQVMKSFKVKEKPDLNQWSDLQAMIQEFNAQHGSNSRVLIRYSGTEPKIRVMMESADDTVISNNIDAFINYIKSEIGA